MKEYRMLEAVGGIRPEFIEEGLTGTGTRRGRAKRALLWAAALLLVCLSLSGLGALAAPDYVKGIFRDIFGPWGAVTGTAYEARAEELEIGAKLSEGKLIVDIQAADAGTLPWRELDTVRLKKYFIRNGSGKAAGEDLPPSEPADFREGKARIEVEAGSAGEDALTLVIEELEGAGKADAPLLIRGRWECPALAD